MTHFYIEHLGDTYEIYLHGFIISRITCWISGAIRQDMQFDDVPKNIQDEIVQRAKDAINEEE